jgi:multisubunit Na+/H+ antiporter MnhB subunit
LVATAFAPVLFTLAFIRVTERRLWPLGVAYLAAAALLLVLCLMLMRAASAQLEILPFPCNR